MCKCGAHRSIKVFVWMRLWHGCRMRLWHGCRMRLWHGCRMRLWYRSNGIRARRDHHRQIGNGFGGFLDHHLPCVNRKAAKSGARHSATIIGRQSSWRIDLHHKDRKCRMIADQCVQCPSLNTAIGRAVEPHQSLGFWPALGCSARGAHVRYRFQNPRCDQGL